MISIAKNCKKSALGIGVWHSKTQDIYTFIHRATFIHKFICDFLMVASTYKMQKISPPALGCGIIGRNSHRIQESHAKILMKMRGTYDIKEADALQVLRYDT